MAKKTHKKYRVGISIGDVNGVGLEVILKTFSDPRMYEECTPVLYGSLKAANAYKKAIGMSDFNFNVVQDTSKLHHKKLNFVEVTKDKVMVKLGEASTETGKLAFQALKQATEDLASNKTDILVTAPINKDTIQSDDFKFPGHTEFLASYANEDNPLMILVNEDLRVGVVTGHIPLKEVANILTEELIISKLEAFQKSLIQDFNIPSPKLAVLGLNPHAGDNGVIGDEEREIIIPALKKAGEKGILCFGPFPADGFFGSGHYKQYDGILGMYHDQGLVPFKSLSFNAGVNYTAGLPIVRTSPDHGTAYGIAGKGLAHEGSFREAIFVACDVYSNRKHYKEMSSNPLTVSPRHEKKR